VRTDASSAHQGSVRILSYPCFIFARPERSVISVLRAKFAKLHKRKRPEEQLHPVRRRHLGNRGLEEGGVPRVAGELVEVRQVKAGAVGEPAKELLKQFHHPQTFAALPKRPELPLQQLSHLDQRELGVLGLYESALNSARPARSLRQSEVVPTPLIRALLSLGESAIIFPPLG